MDNNQINILYIGGTNEDYDLVCALLAACRTKAQTYDLKWEPAAKSLEKIQEITKGNTYDILFVHHRVAEKDGIEIVRQIDKKECKIPIVILSREWNETYDNAALEMAIADYCALEHCTAPLLNHVIKYSIQRKQIFEMLSHERDLLQTLLDNFPDTIYFKDLASRFTRVSKAQAKVLGLKDSGEAVGKTDFDFFDHASEAYADEQNIIATGIPLMDKQVTIHRSDGEVRYVSDTKVPILNRAGEITGTVGITRDITDRVKAEKELVIVKKHLEDTIERVNEELEMARQIQKSLLPAHLPEMPGFKAAALYVPCSAIGGDLYDVIHLHDHRVGLLMFDVVGHGVPSALIATMSKIILTRAITRGLSPQQVLVQANKELVHHFNGKRYLAAFYGIFDIKEKTFLFAKGSHPPAIVLRAESNELEYLATEGIYVGLFPEGNYEEKIVSLNTGDKVIMFTDGLIERFNLDGEYFGLKRLEKVLHESKDLPVDGLLSAVLNAQRSFSDVSHHVDDITILAFEVT